MNIVLIVIIIFLLFIFSKNKEQFSNIKTSQKNIKSLFEKKKGNNNNLIYNEDIFKNIKIKKPFMHSANNVINYDKKYEMGGYEKIDSTYLCPKYLTYNGTTYQLWDNNNVVQIFYNYGDYLKWYNLTKSNYLNKNIYCEPLIPINRTMIKGSMLDIDNVYPKLFNIS